MLKKLFISLALIAVTSGIISAEVVSIVMGDQWGTTDCDLSEWTQEGFRFTPGLGENTKDKIPVYKQKNKEVRFYALNTLTISAPSDGEPMTQLIFTLSKQGREEQAVITPSVGEMEVQSIGNNTVIWNGNAYVVTFQVGETNSLHPEGIVDGSGQFDFTKIEIVTGETNIEKPQDTDTEFYMCNVSDNDGELTEWTQGNLKFRAEKGDDEQANSPTLKNNDELRLYAGNRLTIETLDGRNIESLEFILSEQGLQQQASVIPSAGVMNQNQNTNALWTGDTNTLTLTVSSNDYGTNPSKKGQFDFTQINLTYETLTSQLQPINQNNPDIPVEYFTLQGVRINNPTAGIYIRRQGSIITKTHIR